MKISKSTRRVSFVLLGMHLAVQGPIFGRPQMFYKYRDQDSTFLDLGPVRFYRNFWKERF